MAQPCPVAFPKVPIGIPYGYLGGPVWGSQLRVPCGAYPYPYSTPSSRLSYRLSLSLSLSTTNAPRGSMAAQPCCGKSLSDRLHPQGFVKNSGDFKGALQGQDCDSVWLVSSGLALPLNGETRYLEARHSLGPTARRRYVLLSESTILERFGFDPLSPSMPTENSLEELVRFIHIVFMTVRYTLPVGYPLFTARRLHTGTPMLAGEKKLSLDVSLHLVNRSSSTRTPRILN
ncbi:hypothetical protein BDP55DRAFT_45219 [Colletotrichum godetiae]|uniref:Uncharacterized protein n=1 Tax=Colletotrichum godetiae TaxID=1209918 RepID=A0AAJ0AQF7_9PEZI|nr:uncharacterized protein BDP55DRAFT_45219 [Colletotrichum godetiae]KAK1688476.1 hypothetical protein BDP55DRAFT_45219 [Colletotrichum godetiae]